MQSAGESHKAERWLLHSLQVHMLSAQLQPLLRHMEHARKYYSGEWSNLIRVPVTEKCFEEFACEELCE